MQKFACGESRRARPTGPSIRCSPECCKVEPSIVWKNFDLLETIDPTFQKFSGPLEVGVEEVQIEQPQDAGFLFHAALEYSGSDPV
jgi:hypothetical protein